MMSIIQRAHLNELIHWRQQNRPMPLLIRGARQVGKTCLVEFFGQTHFKHMLSINFELSPKYHACFDTLHPKDITNKLSLISGCPIIPGETLLFLDEIQACPNAIKALRYFREQSPQLHVIGAGSLLEFALQQEGMSMPVGRIQYLYLRPISFQEYLTASGETALLDFFEQVNWQQPIPDAVHEHALEKVREYMLIGGMPMVTQQFIQTGELQQCQQYQNVLLQTYADDFAKYAATTQQRYLQQVYLKTPGLVGQKIKYSNIAADLDSRQLKKAIEYLTYAGVLFPVHATSASGLPLSTYQQDKKFKLLYLDIGLMKRAAKLDLELLLQQQDLMLLNRGALTEQFVGQELLAYQDPYDTPQLHFWARDKKNSMAEVDYLVQHGADIIPIEVKSGKSGRLKSLHLILEQYQLPVGVQVSTQPLNRTQNILSIPLYLIAQLPRLVREHSG